MKMKYSLWVALLLCVSGWVLLAAPGQARRNLSFTWEAPAPTEQIDHYYLYVSTNVPADMPLPVPNEEYLLHWTPAPTETNIFKPIMQIPGNARSVTVSNFWAGWGQYAFFTITASNHVGESPFSNVAWVPAPPAHRDRSFRVEVVE